MSAPELLDVAAVLERYGLRDRRAARRVMDEAGAFLVGGRLLVRLNDLVAHENALRDARRAPQRPQEPPPRARRARGPAGRRAARREPLAPGWWREGADAGEAA